MTRPAMRLMMRRMALAVGAALLLTALASCQLQATQVRFSNATTSYTFLTVRFGEVVNASSLPPGGTTSYVAVSPGQHTLLAQLQDGTWTNGIDFTVTAGDSYTILFSELSPLSLTISMASP